MASAIEYSHSNKVLRIFPSPVLKITAHFAVVFRIINKIHYKRASTGNAAIKYLLIILHYFWSLVSERSSRRQFK